MNVNGSFIAIGISAILMGGVADLATAKQTDEEDSVYRWGRWAVLSPAAGEEPLAFAPASTGGNMGRCESAANCPQPQAIVEPPPNNGGGGGGEEPLPPPPPQVGEAVGFARIDYSGGTGLPFNRYVGTISLADGGTEDSLVFVVNGPSAPNGDVMTFTSGVLPLSDDDEGFYGIAADNLSRISGDYTYGDAGEVAIIEGAWLVRDASNPLTSRFGDYLTGVTATDAQLTTLMDQLGGGLGGDLGVGLGGDVVAYYSGPTELGGAVYLNMNLTQATWNGAVDGLVLDFNASGTIDQARFTADQIDSPVSASVGGEMQGALVNAGNNAIGSFAVEADLGEEGILREADIFNAGLGPQPLVQ